MKKLTLLISLTLTVFVTNKIGAQGDANCGINIDGVFVEKIECWTFDHMYLIFPIRDNYKKYDLIQIAFLYGNKEFSGGPNVFFLDFTPQALTDNFGAAKYGVWKFLTDKNADKRKNNYNEIYTRERFAVCKSCDADGYYKFMVQGLTIIGYSFDSYGNKVPNYGNPVTLYQSNILAGKRVKKSQFNINEQCITTGNKVDLKIEKSLAYRDELGIIK